MRRIARLARWRLWARRPSRGVLPSAVFAVEVGAGGGVVALLGDAADVEHVVHAPVASEVEAVPDRRSVRFSRGQGDAPVPHQRAKVSWYGSIPATGTAMLMSPAGKVKLRWVRVPQECFGPSESGGTGSLQARSAPGLPSTTRRDPGRLSPVTWNRSVKHLPGPDTPDSRQPVRTFPTRSRRRQSRRDEARLARRLRRRRPGTGTHQGARPP